MPIVELRDSDAARRYLLQGLLLQRLGSIDPDGVARTLRLALAIAANDEPVPPLGFVADVASLVLLQQTELPRINAHEGYLPSTKLRAYEDYVLGKLYADNSFDRASTAICRYEKADQIRGVAWLISKFIERAGTGGIRCSPNVVRSIQREPFEKLLPEAKQSIGVGDSGGLDGLLLDHYDELIQSVRNLGEVLGTEDVFEIEHETVLVDFGQRLAMRQVLAAFAELKQTVPRIQPRASGRDRNVVTKLHEEDAYPVGGFTSISTRGTIESLLHSQLAYMEPATEPRPDLFDMKFLRSELLYYSRDENEFLRRRRTIVFAIYPNLIAARVKDPDARWQRIVLVMASLYLSVVQLSEWLDDESLRFEVVFVSEDGSTALNDERLVLEMLLREQIANGLAVSRVESALSLKSRLAEVSRRCLTHCVTVSARECTLAIDNVLMTRLVASDTSLQVGWDGDSLHFAVNHEGWQEMCHSLLKALV